MEIDNTFFAWLAEYYRTRNIPKALKFINEDGRFECPYGEQVIEGKYEHGAYFTPVFMVAVNYEQSSKLSDKGFVEMLKELGMLEESIDREEDIEFQSIGKKADFFRYLDQNRMSHDGADVVDHQRMRIGRVPTIRNGLELPVLSEIFPPDFVAYNDDRLQTKLIGNKTRMGAKLAGHFKDRVGVFMIKSSAYGRLGLGKLISILTPSDSSREYSPGPGLEELSFEMHNGSIAGRLKGDYRMQNGVLVPKKNIHPVDFKALQYYREHITASTKDQHKYLEELVAA